MKEKYMKTDDMRDSYKREALGNGVRGKYYNAYNEGHNLVRLRPEVAQVFQTEEAVNEALLSLIKLAQNSMHLSKS